AVHDKVHPTAAFCWNKIVDRRINCCVFPNDAMPGDHPQNRKAEELPRERTQKHAGQVDDQGNVEDKPPAMAIRDPAEDKGTDDRADDVEGRYCPEVGAGKMERFGALQGRTQRTHNSDFESVKNPGNSQTYDDQQMKPTPGQSIEAERNVCPD